jgi:hypothetical protein
MTIRRIKLMGGPGDGYFGSIKEKEVPTDVFYSFSTEPGEPTKFSIESPAEKEGRMIAIYKLHAIVNGVVVYHPKRIGPEKELAGI